ncbi:MAG: DUF4920 domain-containing protein [Flavobacteriaceae bacterium]
MRLLSLLLITIITLSSCEKVEYTSFGDQITADNHLSKTDMLNKFKGLKKGDTIDVKFASSINRVCKKKGCWMRLDLDNGEESLVRFKDYGFFMPLNSDNKEVIVSGKAYIDVVTVAELRHYAEDEGLSKEDIEKITEDEVTYAVESNGVLMVK